MKREVCGQKGENFSLIPYLLQYKWNYVAGVIVLLLVDLASLYIPQYTGEIIDGLTAGTMDMSGVVPVLFRILAGTVWLEIFSRGRIQRDRVPSP